MPTFRTSSGSTLGPAPEIDAGLLRGEIPSMQRASMVDAGAFGARGGRALQATGDQIQQLTRNVADRKIQRDKEEVALFAVEARTQWIERMNTLQQQAPADGAGFTEGVRTAFEQYRNQTLENFTHLSRPATVLLEQQLANLQAGNIAEAIGIESKLRAGEMVRRSRDAISDAAIAVQADPRQYDTVRESLTTYLGTLDITESQRADLMMNVENDLAFAHLDGRIAAAPSAGALRRIMEDAADPEGRFARILDPDDFSRLQRAAQARQREMEAQARAAQNKALSTANAWMRLIQTGERPPPGVIEDVTRQLEAIGDASMLEAWTRAVENGEFLARLAGQPPEEVQAAALEGLAGVREGGVTLEELPDVEFYSRIAERAARDIEGAQADVDSAATKFWRTVRPLVDAGTPLSEWGEDVRASFEFFAGQATNEAGIAMREFAGEQAVEAGLSEIPLVDRAETMAALQQRLAGADDPADPVSAIRQNHLREMLREHQEAYASNATQAAYHYAPDVYSYVPIDPRDPSTFEHRARDIASMRAMDPTARPYPFFTSEEITSLQAQLDGMDAAQKLRFAGNVIANGGTLEQFKNVPGSLPLVGSLIADQNAQAAQTILKGEELLRDNSRLLPADLWNNVLETDMMNLQRFYMSTEGAAREFSAGVRNVLAYMAATGEANPTAPDVVASAMDMVAGRRGDFGGWSPDFGGYVVPSDVDRNMVDDVLSDTLTVDDLRVLSADGSAPFYPDLVEVAAPRGQARRAASGVQEFELPGDFTLRHAGGARYYVFSGGAILENEAGGFYTLELTPEKLTAVRTEQRLR